jgi:hypothetical protein
MYAAYPPFIGKPLGKGHLKSEEEICFRKAGCEDWRIDGTG